MRKLHQLLPLLALLCLVQCKTTRPLRGTALHTATITRQGYIDCFESGLTANGQPVWCEASAIVYDGKKLLLANDKDMPDTRSSVFYWAFKDGFADTSQQVQYLNSPVLKYAKKFEDFSLSPNGKTVFISTAFDRIKPGSKDWDAYNTIYYWQVGQENNPQLLRGNSNDSSSVFLRDRISKALVNTSFPEGMPYFKIEGLAATDDQLFFGIREEGKKFDDFKYTVKILAVHYQLDNGLLTLQDDLKVLADINVNTLPPFFKQPMGLSCIEYDHFNKRFYLLTSYETGEKNGGYLWTASLSELEQNTMTLVRNSTGTPIEFTNKSEDIAVINPRKLIVIHDDDRLQPLLNGQVRQPNQAGYSIVEFKR